ncbi:hypothetical protein [Cellvibrio polysaccharolyticus]|uniref:Uncharacterized protein n=1 Tax=Cellvibrio polysaccharolyticus TaxID=2082724 RepID=A0A928V2R9_9GAMM|nr:hypothetical protein [Cellvibrio polysaccharolyticus]MBE8715569.1 hypothetical protein [Cellvibrio polysaccharolyticus]
MRPLSKRLLMGVTLLIFLAGALVIMLRSTDVREHSPQSSLSSTPAFSNAPANLRETSHTAPAVINDEPQHPEQTTFSTALDDWIAEIRDSELPEHLLAAALLEKDTRTAFLRLQRLLQADPFHALLNMTLADHCLELPDPLFCNEQLRTRLMSFDGDNGRVRDFLALLAWQNGDLETALNELHESAHSSYSDDLWADQLQIIGESLTRFGWQERNRQWQKGVFGHAAAITNRSFSQLITLCREQIANAEWRSACRARGLNLAENGRTLLLQGIGLGLAQITSDADDPVVTRLKADQEEARGKLVTLLEQSTLNNENGQGLPLDDTRWQMYLDILRSEGEAAAFEYLTRTLADLHTNG